MNVLLSSCFFICLLHSCFTTLPVVMWHGMGDTAEGLDSIAKLINHKLAEVYVHSIRVGNNAGEDFLNSYFMDVDTQIEYVCQKLKNDTNLHSGFNLMGFSQGGQFARAVVQRCDLPVNNLITFGAQHQGVYGFPRCPGSSVKICNLIREMLNHGAYQDFVQKHLVQAQYWHDPWNQKAYIKKSRFLADINNEREPRKESYKSNLVKLKSFVMVKFLNDSMVEPKSSELFGFYEAGQTVRESDLEETTLYKEDYLGLKEMVSKEKIVRISILGEHLHFTHEWFIDEILEKFLK